MIDQSAWDARGMQLADDVASWSKDPDEGVGCVLASSDYRQFAFGVNGLPSGFPHDIVMDKQTKLKYSLHAEDNAIANAATDLRGWTAYVTKPPCLRCALALHRAGVKRVVFPELNPASSWYHAQKEAVQFMEANGLEVYLWA